MTGSTLALMLVLAGCGETVCDRVGAWATQCKVPWNEADEQACLDDLRVCTSRERSQLDAFWTCMDKEKFFTCSGEADTGLTESPPPGADALLACQDQLNGVSRECSRAIGVTAGTFGGLEVGTTESP